MKTKIKSFATACKFLKRTEASCLPKVLHMTKKHQASTLAYAKLVTIIEALNTEHNGGKTWVPDWNSYDEYKYYSWFKMGKGFVYYDCVACRTRSDVGSRLCFRSRELAEYAGKKFVKLYKEYLTLQS